MLTEMLDFSFIDYNEMCVSDPDREPITPNGSTQTILITLKWTLLE